jgi:imidazolonepropionase-like amidohydrolase
MTFALRAARLFDGRDLIDEPVVAVDGSTIVAVGSGVPADVEVEDLGDVTLMPGLIDTHQHLCFDGNGTLEEQVASVTDSELMERARANARRALSAGITTIRDLGDRDFVTLTLRDEPRLPTILAAGPPLTRSKGHCWFLGGECEGRDEIVAAVHERHRRGCDVVKVMVTGGASTPGFAMWDSQFGREEVQLVVDTAHTLGLPVAAHCHGVDGVIAAVAAGVDTIEHCSFFTSDNRSEPDRAVIAAIADAGITVSATLGRDPGHPAPPVIEANLATIIAGLRELREAGGVIVVGTDAGISPGKPHDILPLAASDLAAIGLSGTELLATLTSTAAQACGVADRKGRIAPGLDADLLAVAGDAVAEAHVLRAVRRVWRAGVPVGPEGGRNHGCGGDGSLSQETQTVTVAR